MGTCQLSCEIDITRRIGWSGEDLGDHLDTVLDRLHQASGVEEVSAEADLDTGRATVSMIVSTVDTDPQHVACVILGVAIRACGGAHVGLLPLGEEAGVTLERNQWSGLRTPTWQIRQFNLESLTDDATTLGT